MRRLVTLYAIAGLMLAVLPLGTVAAQEEGTAAIEPSVPEAVVLRATFDLISGNSQPIRGVVESPFTDVFSGSLGPFTASAESSAAAAEGLGDGTPFADASVWPAVTAYGPATNDYYVNSPYVVANVVEVTAPVSGCGANEYREVALFLTRNGMATIGENPNVPNDPGVGASEAVSLVCTGGLASTFFGLPQDGALSQFATPYWIFEFELDGRYFVAFLTLDPFAEYHAVASFATDTTQQEQFGFVRGEGATYPDPIDPAADQVVDEATMEVLGGLSAQSGLVDDQPGEDATEETEVEQGSDTDPVTDVTPPPAADSAQEESNTEQQDNTQQQTAEPEPEDGSSAVPIAVGAAAVAAVAGAGVVAYRKKQVTSKGSSGPLLTDAEEIRVAGERAGLPKDRGWQQVPFALGREFRDRSGSTQRDNLVGDEYNSDVSFDGRPWQWNEASDRGLVLDEYFGFWINDEGTLRVGSPTDPYQFSSLRDESEFPVDYTEEEPAPPYDRRAEGSATTFDDNELPPA